ncbi:hypothetical protein [Reichenbachiella sp.]|uniref:hypothetical protein n=1 Tax=Reichenbachiella sp. TaxID=2184521 RepID=UPI003BB1B95A
MKVLLTILIVSTIVFSCQEDPIRRGTGANDPSNKIKAFLSNDNDDTYVVVSKKADDQVFSEGVVISAGHTDEIELSSCCSHVIRAYIKTDLVNHKYEWYINLRDEDIHINF